MTEKDEEARSAAKAGQERKHVALIIVAVSLMVLIPLALVLWVASV